MWSTSSNLIRQIHHRRLILVNCKKKFCPSSIFRGACTTKAGSEKKREKRKLSLSQRVFVKSLLILDFNSDCLKRSAIVVLLQVALISIQSNHFCRIFQPISSFLKNSGTQLPNQDFQHRGSLHCSFNSSLPPLLFLFSSCSSTHQNHLFNRHGFYYLFIFSNSY